ncbi:MAG: 16S rRNA (cytidine(1402)-2'-O)-methyltransferase [Eggerthellaceae bacterium]|nr:16S rRNA (cytidine(1402)-2'-O)-methyltransferase [Eggerthellaceae bacterium]
MTGKLVICPTPLGNLGDMTLRALEALREADVVCAEDTRVTGKLLAALGIEGKHLERLDENLVGGRADSIAARVLAGETIAYCSDAGMPGVSDPGLRLVSTAREAGAPVDVLPGPTAVATAYVASGTTSANFYFGGFFPRKGAARKQLLESLRSLDAALVFYESPNRLVSALASIAESLPYRQVAVCRELTKLHEEIVRGPVDEVKSQFEVREAIKGEIVIVIDAPNDEERQAASASAAADAEQRAAELLARGERPKTIAKLIADEFGVSRNEAYDIALQQRPGPCCNRQER